MDRRYSIGEIALSLSALLAALGYLMYRAGLVKVNVVWPSEAEDGPEITIEEPTPEPFDKDLEDARPHSSDAASTPDPPDAFSLTGGVGQFGAEAMHHITRRWGGSNQVMFGPSAVMVMGQANDTDGTVKLYDAATGVLLDTITKDEMMDGPPYLVQNRAGEWVDKLVLMKARQVEENESDDVDPSGPDHIESE